MSTDFVLNAQARSDVGKGASRRLRRQGKVPGIMYGAGKEPTSVVFDHNELILQLAHEAFYSHILTVKLDGKEEQAVLKDLHRDPIKIKIMHVDLQRVSATEEIRVHVPLHFLNEEVAKGVKTGGGIVTHNVTEVEVACLPKDLPEFIEVDVVELDVNESLHLSDLKLPSGARLVELSHGPEHDLPVVAIILPRGARDEAEGEEAEAAGEEGAPE